MAKADDADTTPSSPAPRIEGGADDVAVCARPLSAAPHTASTDSLTEQYPALPLSTVSSSHFQSTSTRSSSSASSRPGSTSPLLDGKASDPSTPLDSPISKSNTHPFRYFPKPGQVEVDCSLGGYIEKGTKEPGKPLEDALLAWEMDYKSYVGVDSLVRKQALALTFHQLHHLHGKENSGAVASSVTAWKEWKEWKERKECAQNQKQRYRYTLSHIGDTQVFQVVYNKQTKISRFRKISTDHGDHRGLWRALGDKSLREKAARSSEVDVCELSIELDKNEDGYLVLASDALIEGMQLNEANGWPAEEASTAIIEILIQDGSLTNKAKLLCDYARKNKSKDDFGACVMRLNDLKHGEARGAMIIDGHVASTKVDAKAELAEGNAVCHAIGKEFHSMFSQNISLLRDLHRDFSRAESFGALVDVKEIEQKLTRLIAVSVPKHKPSSQRVPDLSFLHDWKNAFDSQKTPKQYQQEKNAAEVRRQSEDLEKIRLQHDEERRKIAAEFKKVKDQALAAIKRGDEAYKEAQPYSAWWRRPNPKKATTFKSLIETATTKYEIFSRVYSFLDGNHGGNGRDSFKTIFKYKFDEARGRNKLRNGIKEQLINIINEAGEEYKNTPLSFWRKRGSLDTKSYFLTCQIKFINNEAELFAKIYDFLEHGAGSNWKDSFKTILRRKLKEAELLPSNENHIPKPSKKP